VSSAGSQSARPVAPLLTDESQRWVALIDEIVTRRSAIPLREPFYRRGTPKDAKPPLARLISVGGHGGSVPAKLYLAIVWLAAKHPFNTRAVSARQWAELLALDEPGTLGNRRVNDAIRRLEDLRLITVKRQRGHPPILTLLSEDGSGREYREIPSTDYVRANKSQKKRYIRLNVDLWKEGHLQAMRLPALAALIIILDGHRGQYGEPVWWAGSMVQDRYGISRQVFSEGIQELKARGLLHIGRAHVNAGFGYEQRKRNTYQVLGAAIPPRSST
jgi:hypothetical protein